VEGKCLPRANVGGDIRHMATPALALTSVSGDLIDNIDIQHSSYGQLNGLPLRHYQTKTTTPTKHHLSSTNPDPVKATKVEGLCTDANRVDCVRLKQVGRLGPQPRKPVRNATVAMS
jgi:hypothetical protein